MSVDVSVRVEALLSSTDETVGGAFDPDVFDEAAFDASWVELPVDILGADGIQAHYGIDGNGPTDLVAGSGELHFTLRNDGNGGRTQGQYSFGHASCRPSWRYGTPVRLVATYSGTDYIRWRGKVAEATPDTDAYGPRRVHVVAYDYMHDLIEADVRTVSVQVAKTGDVICGAILDALPSAAQPPARSMSTGLDVYPYALDRLGSTTKAASAIADVVRSGYDLAYIDGTGTFKFVDRQTRLLASPVATLTDSDLWRNEPLEVDATLSGVFNVVRNTYHPKHTAATTLWQASGTPLLVRAGETVTLTVTYRDSSNLDRLIGATAVTAPVSGTDYVANTAANGSGTNNTADLTVTLADHGTTADWTIANSGVTGDAYLTTHQLRGTGLFDEGTPTVESRSTQDYGERVLPLDLPLQDSHAIAQGLADLIRSDRESLYVQPKQLTFLANRSSTLMALAMTIDVGQKLALTNTMSGLSATQVQVQRVALDVLAGGLLLCRLGLAPASTTIASAPSAPTGLAVTVVTDTELSLSWINADAESDIEIYEDGSLIHTAPAGVTSYFRGTRTPATTYSYTLRHLKLSLLRSPATGAVTGRPAVSATGGTISTAGGYRTHTFTTDGTFQITIAGTIQRLFVGRGGDGGDGADSSGVDQGGGGGGGGGVAQFNDSEPVGSYAVQVGSSGNSGATTYRSEAGGRGVDGADATGTGGGNGGSSGSSSGGGGGGPFAGGAGQLGVGNANGGGGGGGDAATGSDATNLGGAPGAGTTAWDGTTYGAGGHGGRGAGGAGASGAGNSGEGAAGNSGAGQPGGTGGSGVAKFRYPV